MALEGLKVFLLLKSGLEAPAEVVSQVGTLLLGESLGATVAPKQTAEELRNGCHVLVTCAPGAANPPTSPSILKKRMALLQAAKFAGTPVVHVNWVFECAKQKAKLPFADFSNISVAINAPAAVKSRTQSPVTSGSPTGHIAEFLERRNSSSQQGGGAGSSQRASLLRSQQQAVSIRSASASKKGEEEEVEKPYLDSSSSGSSDMGGECIPDGLEGDAIFLLQEEENVDNDAAEDDDFESTPVLHDPVVAALGSSSAKSSAAVSPQASHHRQPSAAASATKSADTKRSDTNCAARRSSGSNRQAAIDIEEEDEEEDRNLLGISPSEAAVVVGEVEEEEVEDPVGRKSSPVRVVPYRDSDHSPSRFVNPFKDSDDDEESDAAPPVPPPVPPVEIPRKETTKQRKVPAPNKPNKKKQIITPASEDAHKAYLDSSSEEEEDDKPSPPKRNSGRPSTKKKSPPPAAGSAVKQTKKKKPAVAAKRAKRNRGAETSSSSDGDDNDSDSDDDSSDDSGSEQSSCDSSSDSDDDDVVSVVSISSSSSGGESDDMPVAPKAAKGKKAPTAKKAGKKGSTDAVPRPKAKPKAKKSVAKKQKPTEVEEQDEVKSADAVKLGDETAVLATTRTQLPKGQPAPKRKRSSGGASAAQAICLDSDSNDDEETSKSKRLQRPLSGLVVAMTGSYENRDTLKYLLETVLHVKTAESVWGRVRNKPTHLVLDGTDFTPKVLYALAAGIPVLNTSWVYESLEAKNGGSGAGGASDVDQQQVNPIKKLTAGQMLPLFDRFYHPLYATSLYESNRQSSPVKQKTGTGNVLKNGLVDAKEMYRRPGNRNHLLEQWRLGILGQNVDGGLVDSLVVREVLDMLGADIVVGSALTSAAEASDRPTAVILLEDVSSVCGKTTPSTAGGDDEVVIVAETTGHTRTTKKPAGKKAGKAKKKGGASAGRGPGDSYLQGLVTQASELAQAGTPIVTINWLYDTIGSIKPQALGHYSALPKQSGGGSTTTTSTAPTAAGGSSSKPSNRSANKPPAFTNAPIGGPTNTNNTLNSATTASGASPNSFPFPTGLGSATSASLQQQQLQQSAGGISPSFPSASVLMTEDGEDSVDLVAAGNLVGPDAKAMVALPDAVSTKSSVAPTAASDEVTLIPKKGAKGTGGGGKQKQNKNSSKDDLVVVSDGDEEGSDSGDDESDSVPNKQKQQQRPHGVKTRPGPRSSVKLAVHQFNTQQLMESDEDE